uniref:Secernin-2 n=1 Tax=Sus scrofa TaxID=9823 RepID=A0A480HK81_PIG
MKGLNTDRAGSGVAVRKWTQGWVGSRGRRDTMLAVVRKPPESIQMPLALSLRMPIITSAVMAPCFCCSSNRPAWKRALAASMRTGCWVREKAWAKSKAPCPSHQPWARAWGRSLGCSAERSVPMLSWLEMLRAPAVEEMGVAPFQLNLCSAPGTQRGAENTVVKRTGRSSHCGPVVNESD